MMLDPRFCDEVVGEQAYQSKNKLVDVWHALKELRGSSQNEISSLSIGEENKLPSNADIFQKYMQSKSKQRKTILESTTTNHDIIRSIDSFIEKEGFEGASDNSFSLIKFWETKKKEYPILFELVMVINSIAPAQVTVERMFSAFAHIFNDYRASLSQSLLEDILLICLNKDLLEEVNKDDMIQLFNVQQSS